MFQINPASTTPIYRQIVEQIERQVAGGQLKAGDDLPSVRAVALQHAINPMTVSKAYSLLESDGLLSRKRGVGMAIAEQSSNLSHRQRLALLKPHLEAAAHAAHQLHVTPQAAADLFSACLVANSELLIEKEPR
jgi:GntR family transcriptional regulator